VVVDPSIKVNNVILINNSLHVLIVFCTIPEVKHFWFPPMTGRLLGSHGPIERHSGPRQLQLDRCLHAQHKQHVQNDNSISEFQRVTHFHNCDSFSKQWLTFKTVTCFQNSDSLSKQRLTFKTVTHFQTMTSFQNSDSFSKQWLIFK